MNLFFSKFSEHGLFILKSKQRKIIINYILQAKQKSF
jgi:hypothetical protein